jgi:DNA-directed RNA polymerase subunit omega
MIEPSLDSLLKKADNLYTLCNFAGKRARQLIDGAPKLTDINVYSELTVATNEINEDKVISVKKVNAYSKRTPK